jgi:hypothetical protein
MKRITLIAIAALLLSSCSRGWIDDEYLKGVLKVTKTGPFESHWYGDTLLTVFDIDGLSESVNSPAYAALIQSMDGKEVFYKLGKESGTFLEPGMRFIQIKTGRAYIRISTGLRFDQGTR